ncbi:hypothetical protein KEM55_004176 [Ascosphaera atra]|nr:hypothetical protein KEM55_004176 [Ascosphaera atra]
MATATERALALPEILEQIFTPLCLEAQLPIGNYQSGRALQAAACVSRTWHLEAIRLLWKNPPNTRGDSIPQMLARIPQERRQVYANYLEEGLIDALESRERKATWMKEAQMHCKDVLPGLSFPKLKSVLVMVQPEADYVPPIESQNITDLFIHAWHEYEWELSTPARIGSALLEQIAKVFPNVETLKFMNGVNINQSALKQLAERLPKLKTFDHSLCWINED